MALAGCANLPESPPASYETLAERAASGEMIDPGALKRAFLAAPDFDDRLRQLGMLEQQALAWMEDEPLRLGAVGSAILDLYYASLAGHQALAKFYGHLEATEQMALHESWVAAIGATIAASAAAPDEIYRVLSSNEAKAFLASRGKRAAGMRYDVSQGHQLQLLVAVPRTDEPVEHVRFDLQDQYLSLAAAIRQDRETVFPIDRPTTCETLRACEKFDVWTFVRVLAVGDDSAAQVRAGLEMLSVGRFDDALRWLHQAAQADNAMAQLALAELLVLKARQPSSNTREWWERAERHFQLAVNAGLDTAMLRLGYYYQAGLYGESKVAEGEALLVRAAALNNVEALVRLGWMHALGEQVEEDKELSERYFLRAAQRDEGAKVQYAQFLTVPDFGLELNRQALRWLRQVAKNDNPEAMLLLGNLYARGTHVKKRVRRARSWLKKAAAAAPNNANLVNEVAWTLTVSHLPRLRDERYALKIMDRVMADENNAARLNPAYLDTWAAAYAANGDFERAIAVQQKAIEQARSNEDPNGDLPILREHLDSFRAGELIGEQVP